MKWLKLSLICILSTCDSLACPFFPSSLVPGYTFSSVFKPLLPYFIDCRRYAFVLLSFHILLIGCIFRQLCVLAAELETWSIYVKYNLEWNNTATKQYKCIRIKHYENTPIQICWEYYHQKMSTFRWKKSGSFHISSQNIDHGYLLEPPQRGGSNDTNNLCFWAEIRKLMCTPVNPSFIV